MKEKEETKLHVQLHREEKGEEEEIMQQLHHKQTHIQKKQSENQKQKTNSHKQKQRQKEKQKSTYDNSSDPTSADLAAAVKSIYSNSTTDTELKENESVDSIQNRDSDFLLLQRRIDENRDSSIEPQKKRDTERIST